MSFMQSADSWKGSLKIVGWLRLRVGQGLGGGKEA